MRQRLQAMAAPEHARPQSIGIIDETSDDQKGDKTPGGQRQYCAAVGKPENGIVSAPRGYAVGAFPCLVDGEWFLPEAWSEDRERCRAAGIPETMVYRPKTKVALQLYDRARAHGLSFGWLTFDEWYGSKPEFLRAPDRRGPRFVGEAQQHFMAWVQPPGGDHPTKTARPGHSLIRPPTAPMEVDFAR